MHSAGDEKKALSQKLRECKRLIGTAEMGVWESGFLEHVSNLVEGDPRGVGALTQNQQDCINRIHKDYIAKAGASTGQLERTGSGEQTGIYHDG